MLKKMFNKLTRKADNAITEVKSAFACKRGEGYVDTGVKILIAVVLGALMLTLLYALINGTVIPKVIEKVTAMFAYSA